jgi:hypothetical protein
MYIFYCVSYIHTENKKKLHRCGPGHKKQEGVELYIKKEKANFLNTFFKNTYSYTYDHSLL